MKILHLLAACLLFTFFGCGPKAKLKPDFEKLGVATLAVLPIIDKSELPQDQVMAAFRGLTQELRNNGFLVLDDAVTQQICPTMPCAAQKRLFDEYLVDAVVQLTIDSTTSANILAGYYNDISGSLTLNNKSGEELARIDGTEREKGGLLFNTGQILQGLIQQSRNEGSSKLLNAFFRKLVSQIPSPSNKAQQNTDSTTIAIKSIDTRVTGGDEREICVSATPRSLVSLVYGNSKSNLQEVTSGKYCREYFLNASFADNNAEIEVRSPFGNSIRSPLTLADGAKCDVDDDVSLTSSNKGAQTISFACSSDGKQSPFKFLIYKSENNTAQYSKIGEVSGKNWTDSSLAKDLPAEYVVIAKSARGDRSLPVFLRATEPASTPTPAQKKG